MVAFVLRSSFILTPKYLYFLGICISEGICISSEFRLRDGDRVTGGWRCTCKVAFSAGQRPNMLLLSFSNIIRFIMRMMITIARIFNISDYCNQMIVKETQSHHFPSLSATHSHSLLSTGTLFSLCQTPLWVCL